MEINKEKEILRLEWDIKHESWFLDNCIKELHHIEIRIKESKERLKNFNDELNNLKQK